MGGRPLLSHPSRHPSPSPALTLAGLPVTAQAEARATAAGPRLVAVGQQADVRASAWLPVLVVLAGMAPHWGRVESRSGPLEVSVPDPEKASSSLTTLPPAAVFVSAVPSRDLEAAGLGFLYPHTTLETQVGTFVVRGHCCSQPGASEPGGVMDILSRMRARAPGWDSETEGQAQGGILGWMTRRSSHDTREVPTRGSRRGCGAPLTSGLTALVVDVEGTALVHTGDHLVVSAVEPVHTDHTGLLLGVGIVRVGGVEIILKHGQAIQVLDLRRAGRNRQHERRRDSYLHRWRTGQLCIQTP